MAKSCLQVAPCRHVRLKQAARDVDHVPVLNIFWVGRLATNIRPKINGFSKLYSVDYASEVNVAEASIVSYPARCHNSLIHSRWAIKRNLARISGESRHDDGGQAVVHCDQHLGIIKIVVVAVDQFTLQIDNPPASCRDFTEV